MISGPKDNPEVASILNGWQKHPSGARLQNDMRENIKTPVEMPNPTTGPDFKNPSQEKDPLDVKTFKPSDGSDMVKRNFCPHCGKPFSEGQP